MAMGGKVVGVGSSFPSGNVRAHRLIPWGVTLRGGYQMDADSFHGAKPCALFRGEMEIPSGHKGGA